jgi:hypothetical protein
MLTRLASWVALPVLPVLVLGCDPGLIYTLPGAPKVHDDGVRYVVDVGDGVLAGFQSTVFTVNGQVDIMVQNQSDAPLSFAPTPTLISNGSGRRLDARDCAFFKGAAPIESGRNEIIGKDQTTRIVCRFIVALGGGFFHRYPPESERVTFTQAGLSQAGRPLDIHATMVAK